MLWVTGGAHTTGVEDVCAVTGGQTVQSSGQPPVSVSPPMTDTTRRPCVLLWWKLVLQMQGFGQAVGVGQG